MKLLFTTVMILSIMTSVLADTYVYTGHADGEQVPLPEARQQFTCTDQVFVVIELEDYAVGDHQLRARWVSPSGKLARSTRYDFLVFNDRERVWAWLKLHRQSGAGVLRWIDASAGMEEFIGPWQVTLEIDNEPVGMSDFDLIC